MYAEPTPTTTIPCQPIRSAAAPAAAGGWDTERDAFFRLTAALFSPAFTSGAGVLLATYDED